MLTFDDATGKVVRPLDEAALRAALAAAARDGFISVAIAFLHADLDGAHERRAGALARAAGFAFVSLSSQVSPLPRFVPRAADVRAPDEQRHPRRENGDHERQDHQARRMLSMVQQGRIGGKMK